MDTWNGARLTESLRNRTLCLVHIIQIILDVMIGDGNREGCEGFGLTPLPCTRELWEIETTSEWTRRYRESLRRRKSVEVLTIRELKRAQSLPTEFESGRDVRREATDVANWCQRLDQFGMMVWMAASLVKLDDRAHANTNNKRNRP